MTTEITPYAYLPGDLIREELEARGWTQEELAQIMGTDAALVSQIVNGKRTITAKTADMLAAAFETSAELWMNLQTAYKLATAKKPRKHDVTLRARLFAKAPVREMIKRGWIADTGAAEDLAKHVTTFFEVKSIDDEFVFDHAAKKSGSYAETTPAQLAWLFRARQLARMVQVRRGRANMPESLISELQRLTSDEAEVRHVPRVLADFGVRFVVVEPIARCKIDGATFWLDASSPVIAMSLRHDRIDNFWFTLMHECAHIMQHDKLSVDVDVDTVDASELPEEERRANEFAAGALVPREEMRDFQMRVAPLYSRMKVLGFAARIQVHPGIVAGQIRNAEQNYRIFHDMLAKIRHIIAPSALTDGWGMSVPLTA